MDDTASELAIHGTWWIPDCPRRRRPGVLHYSADRGPELQCEGLLRQSPHVAEYPPPERLIVGRASDGTAVTIWKAWPNRVTSHSEGKGKSYPVCNYVAFGFFLGGRFPTDGDVVFDRIEAIVPPLTPWTRARVFDSEWAEDDVHRVTYKAPPSTEVVVPGPVPGSPDALLAIEWRLTESDGWYAHSAEAAAQLSLRLGEPVPFTVLKPYFEHMLQFFELAMSLPLTAEYLTLFGPKTGRRGVRYHERLDSPPGDDEHFWMNMYFTLPDVQVDLGRLVSTWLNNIRERGLESVVGIHRNLLTEYATPEFRFLLVTSALETYHQRVMPAAWIEPEKAKSHRERMLQALPDCYRAEWERRLPGAYDLSLRERLDQLSQSLAPVANHLQMHADFMKAVVDTRNYYHHWSPRLEGKCMSPSEMVAATAKLRVLMEALLMREAGFSSDDVVANVKRNSRALGIARYAPPASLAILDD